MKALSLKEPWASLVLNGKKTIETRVWKTKYRGKILLCASKKPKGPLSGKAFAVAEIIDCRRMLKKDEKKSCCKVYPRANSWVLKEVIPIKQFNIKGQLGLFKINKKVKALK